MNPAPDYPRRRRWRIILDGVVGAVLVFAATLWFPLPGDDFAPVSVQSLRILDRSGIVLREFPNDLEGRGVWTSLDNISPWLRMATVAVEDRRFVWHPGVDPIAVVRSIADNVRAGGFRSGGSTLTQQVIRNVYHRPRTIRSKLVEMWEALRLERMMSKEEVLEQYLNRAPYGNQVFGAESASRWYFGKPARDLSLAEAAFLAGLPNAPTTLNPRRNPAATFTRQSVILKRLLDQRIITDEEYARATSQPIQIVPPEAHFKAPHVASMIADMGYTSYDGEVRTTIDYPLQAQVQWIMRGHLRTLARKNVHNAAAIVLDNSTGEILALVGSTDFFDSTHNGQVNGVTARRQPGSSIKPFMYALALQSGLTPATLIPDIPTAIPDHHGDYVPENYDRRFHGPVRLRSALACSYNVPAVRVLQRVGKPVFLEKLRECGFGGLNRDAEFYGYGLTLGNAEVSLLEIATGYAALANGGVWKPSVLVPGRRQFGIAQRVYDETAAYLVTDILNDPAARRPAFGGNFHFPFSCAVKTGTTKDYKDNWTIGYTTRYTVGVWVGNFDGEQMKQVSGVSGAGPIFTDVMMFLHTPPYGAPPADFLPPAHLVRMTVCAQSGSLPTRLCEKRLDEWFPEGHTPSESCSVHQEFRITMPDGGERRKTYAIFPVEYREWVREEGIPAPPPGARRVSGFAVADLRIDRLMIVSPNTGDYFKIDPVLRREYQTITIAGFVPPGMDHVRLRINGAEDRPFTSAGVRWQLQKGVYRFQLVADSRRSEVYSRPVVITVE
jgi:penicillin-binding protein 1C